MLTRFAPACLAILLTTSTGFAQPSPLSDDAIAKLIAQMDAVDFRARDKASKELETLGMTVLPALRKAAAEKIPLEVKRRIEEVIERIELAPFLAEEKAWHTLDTPRRGIKDRLVKVVARKPAIADDDLAKAIYWLTYGRAPSDAEKEVVSKELKGHQDRVVPVLKLARNLVKKNEFNTDVAAVNSRVLKMQKDLIAAAERIRMLNAPEFQKSAQEIAESFSKAAKTDEEFGTLAFLVILSRFPDANEAKTLVHHFQKGDRETAMANIVWALINSREFVRGR